ncbi:MAG: HlyD family efflux transporter periplasmic adaptor subunit [Bacteroidetes bacterium]|nr:MAG: HlyD family efflux transporter periplasmic adaptor subunit [Bacteroidota bacterium]
MLNISENRLEPQVQKLHYQSFSEVWDPFGARNLALWLLSLLGIFIIILFVPWTQNIQATGQLTALQPNQRPQTVQSTIDGRIEAWFVSEGDTVAAGDTLIFLSEIKDDYFDPNLVSRTDLQLQAKVSSIEAYKNKVAALQNQIQALQAELELKVSQARNKVLQAGFKVQADSIDLEAARINFQIAQTQFARWDTLYKQGIKSRTDWEDKRNKQQESQAKLISQENKLNVARQELTNAQLSLSQVRNEYEGKIAKARSDQESARSAQYESEAEVVKLRNKLTNYEQRVNFRYITAPQRGFINKAFKPGLGETVKAGEPVASITPLNYQLAAELYVRPVDLPLARKGEHVRLEFDGWPTIVFSGWPNTSFGTFGGVIYAVETDISQNGKYRILVAPDPKDEPWPELLRVGAGVNGFALLNDVPLWYELWRQLNGFPPDFYTGSADGGDKGGSKEKKK